MHRTEADMMPGHSTAEAARRAGVTYRMADHWVRQGIVEPSVHAEGSGTARRWSDTDVADLRLAGALRRLGVPLDAIPAMLRVAHAYAGAAALVVVGDDVEAVGPYGIAEAVADKGGAAVVILPNPNHQEHAA